MFQIFQISNAEITDTSEPRSKKIYLMVSSIPSYLPKIKKPLLDSQLLFNHFWPKKLECKPQKWKLTFDFQTFK